MQLIKIENEYIIKKKCFTKFKAIFNNNICHIILLFFLLLIINIIISIYLLIENKTNKKIIKELIDFKNSFEYKNKSIKNYYFPNNKEMIGLYYPEINYDKIKERLKNFNIIDSVIDLINQLEVKLIYLEKEINVTKSISFYTARKYFLDRKNISYNENNLTQLHEIVNWITIHKSNQLKGIASDKYLACEYVKLKLGKNLCQQRIAIYNTLEELNYSEISKYGNIVLKVSNSCWKNLFISKDITKMLFKEK